MNTITHKFCVAFANETSGSLFPKLSRKHSFAGDYTRTGRFSSNLVLLVLHVIYIYKTIKPRAPMRNVMYEGEIHFVKSYNANIRAFHDANCWVFCCTDVHYVILLYIEYLTERRIFGDI